MDLSPYHVGIMPNTPPVAADCLGPCLPAPGCLLFDVLDVVLEPADARFFLVTPPVEDRGLPPPAFFL